LIQVIASLIIEEHPPKLGKHQVPEHMHAEQGCQIFLGTTYQNGENVPNNYEIYQIAVKLIKWP
jgi:hypothetical protein